MYPPSVETLPESGELEVDLNKEVIMQCVAKGVPAPIISWRTKGREIPLKDNRSILKFSADNRNLSGKYTCVADNKIGEPAEAHIDLRIRYKPEIYVKRPWAHAYPGIRVTLDCTVSAWPEAKVEWYFNNKTINYTTSRIVKHNTENDHSLLIRHVTPSDSGSYTCRASNSMGITEKMIELSEIANPAVFKKESASASSTSYNFIWVVDSYSPIIEYQFWFRRYKKNGGGEWHKLYIPAGGGDISPVHVRSFNLTGLDAATYYEAVVLSRNRYGWSHPSEILRFHTEGAPVDSSENSEMDGDQEQNRIAVIQITSMSQHYLLTTDANGSIYNRAQILPLILSTLCTLIITRDRFN
ncbi:Tyrosine-protein kinase-like 7 [Cyphomyrmex costatus]|uniref:Tyrosine-protein kinase-like 7 n=2 Tax=Cyphomyrmex costatus TaxID=456900 RepID=A0A195C6Z3_9HYME|nr:Tyrosine-protein kinase-like 7 [Cyphomyrmex costatus]